MSKKLLLSFKVQEKGPKMLSIKSTTIHQRQQVNSKHKVYATDHFAGVGVLFVSKWVTRFDIHISPPLTLTSSPNQVRVN